MITNPGGKPKDPEPEVKVTPADPPKTDPEPKKDIKKDLESLLAGGGPGRKKPAEEPKTEEPAEKLQFPTADRPKGPQGRRPSQRHLSRGNSDAGEEDEQDEPVKKAESKEEPPTKKPEPKPEPVKVAEPKKDSPKVATKVETGSSSKDAEELSKSKSELSFAQAEVKKLKGQLEDAREELSEALAKKDEVISELREKNKTLEEDIDDLDEQLEKARGGSKPSPSDDSQREVKKLKDKISQLEEDLKKAQDDATATKKDLLTANKALKQANEDLEEARDAPKTPVPKVAVKAVAAATSGLDDSPAAAQVAVLQRQLNNRGKLLELLYNARWSYDSAAALEGGSSNKKSSSVVAFNPSRPAFELAQYAVDQEAFHAKQQHDAANQLFLKEVLVGLHAQYKRASDQSDVSSQLGWLAYSATLLWALMRPNVLDSSVVGEEDDGGSDESDSDSDDDSGDESDEKSDESSESEDDTKGRKLKKIGKEQSKAASAKVPPHNLFWARAVAERGIHCGYDDVKECLEDLKGVDVEEELSVDDDDGPGRRFLDVLDMLISHQYALLVDNIQKKIGQDKLADVFFDQSAVLQATAGPRKRETAQKLHSPTLITGQLDQVVQLLRKTHPFTKVLELQLVAQVLEWLGRQVTNALFTSAQLCRASTAYSMKVALSHVEQWYAGVFATANLEPLLLSWVSDRLDPLREAANILLIDKSMLPFLASRSAYCLTKPGPLRRVRRRYWWHLYFVVNRTNLSIAISIHSG